MGSLTALHSVDFFLPTRALSEEIIIIIFKWFHSWELIGAWVSHVQIWHCAPLFPAYFQSEKAVGSNG